MKELDIQSRGNNQWVIGEQEFVTRYDRASFI